VFPDAERMADRMNSDRFGTPFMASRSAASTLKVITSRLIFFPIIGGSVDFVSSFSGVNKVIHGNTKIKKKQPAFTNRHMPVGLGSY
jgi:hypothetical protein